MMILNGRNVNELYERGRKLLEDYGQREETRAGPCIVAPWPVVSKYARPQERVLFNQDRDCNPFFHFFECLWMLSGSDDAKWLDRFVSDFSERFGERPNGHMHGAYGRRWRDWFLRERPGAPFKVDIVDQLKEVIAILRERPLDRQCVIQMWDAPNDLSASVKDKPCNTHIYLRQRQRESERILDLTVLCRSNDIIFGAYGANAVHFSFLQEYIAAGIGAGLGQLYQFSNNFHAYVDVLEQKPIKDEPLDNPYLYGVTPVDMVADFSRFDEDLRLFMNDPLSRASRYYNPWFRTVAAPMYETHDFWKRKMRGEARVVSDLIQASDWRRAAKDWMDRRTKR